MLISLLFYLTIIRCVCVPSNTFFSTFFELLLSPYIVWCISQISIVVAVMFHCLLYIFLFFLTKSFIVDFKLHRYRYNLTLIFLFYRLVIHYIIIIMQISLCTEQSEGDFDLLMHLTSISFKTLYRNEGERVVSCGFRTVAR
jgi:hypothetical protein